MFASETRLPMVTQKCTYEQNNAVKCARYASASKIAMHESVSYILYSSKLIWNLVYTLLLWSSAIALANSKDVLGNGTIIGIQWLWTTYKKLYVVYRMVALPMTLSDLEPYLGNNKTDFF